MGKEEGLSIAALHCPFSTFTPGAVLICRPFTGAQCVLCAVFCVFFCGSAPVDYECHSMHR